MQTQEEEVSAGIPELSRAHISQLSWCNGGALPLAGLCPHWAPPLLRLWNDDRSSLGARMFYGELYLGSLRFSKINCFPFVGINYIARDRSSEDVQDGMFLHLPLWEDERRGGR